ncbi:MAG: hypothetical protein ABJA98_27820 [Acidobacteriota bacterium]
MARVLTKSIGTKVTEEDYAMLKALAGERKLGEWVRDVVFKAAVVDPHAAAQRVILAEVLALRKVLLNLQYAMAAGEAVTPERMEALIAEADATKDERAQQRLSWD